MLGPSVYPTWYPISTTSWQNTPRSMLPYHIIIPKPNLYLQSCGRGVYSRRHHRNGASSFTIDAILGVQQDAVKTQTENVKEEETVREMAIHQGMLSSNRTKLERRYRCSSAVQKALLPMTTQLSPPGNQTIGKSCLKVVDDEKETKLDLEIFEACRASDFVTSIHGTSHGNNSAIERPVASLAWPCDVADQTYIKPKRVRTIFTQDQLDRLEAAFARQQYMVGAERLYLASQLDLSESQVKVWFQNRRIKWRKHNLESQKEKLAQYRALRDGGRHGGRHGTRRSGNTGPMESPEGGDRRREKEIRCDGVDDIMEEIKSSLVRGETDKT